MFSSVLETVEQVSFPVLSLDGLRQRRLRTRVGISCRVEGNCVSPGTTCVDGVCRSYVEDSNPLDRECVAACEEEVVLDESFYYNSRPRIVTRMQNNYGCVVVFERGEATLESMDEKTWMMKRRGVVLRTDLFKNSEKIWSSFCPWDSTTGPPTNGPPPPTMPPPTMPPPTTPPPTTPPPTTERTDEVTIDMREMEQTLPFANPDGGAWKQGWKVKAKEGPITIFVVPHSHCDPGWIKTFDDYFQSQTRHILDSVYSALRKDKRRKFIWAEISYFEWWWREQGTDVRNGFKELLKNKQFEFVTGGWVMPDEANTARYALEVQLDEGHEWLERTFGIKPEYGWSIDPFGYSPTMPYLLKKRGFKGTLIQRVHYAVKKELASKQQLEFRWRQTWDTTGEHDLFTHLMPFYSYDVPHTCGPDPSVCCQFDFARIGKGNGWTGCPWGKPSQAITSLNVAERGALLLDQYRKKSALYAHNVVLAPLGDDFRYQTPQEAEAQFTNYQKLMDWMNAQPGVSIRFGTLKDYFESLPRFKAPILKGSFFTYSDREQDYWSGYFTSRVFDKALDRRLESSLQAAESMGATAEEVREARRSLSLFQHHDGVTGTAKNVVVNDYAKRMSKSIGTVQEWMGKKMGGESCWKQDGPRTMWENRCSKGTEVTVYNPLEWDREWCRQTVSGKGTARGTVGCEESERTSLEIDEKTGLVTHPFREEWMVYDVRKGGAYLFFPATDARHHSEHGSVNGWTTTTPHWSRTIVDRGNGVYDFEYSVELTERNKEWFVRFDTGVKNKGVFHTDLNGFNFDRHVFRTDRPIQAQVYPMPTLASIEDQETRFTVLSEHAQGAASLSEGTVDVWLDRRLGQDDARGVGQGVEDNVRVKTTLRVVVEEGVGMEEEFAPTEWVKKQWAELNQPLEIFKTVSQRGYALKSLVKPNPESGVYESPTGRTTTEEAPHCTPVYFWGGGKAGSTTLAVYLKHGYDGETWDSNGEFVDAGKEVCWATSGSKSIWDREFHQCSNIKSSKFALDACPRYYEQKHMQTILTQHPNAKFVMLVRDPVNRIVSHLNDDHRRGGGTSDVDSAARRLLKNPRDWRWRLSEYGANLRAALQYASPSQMLIVRSESLGTHAQAITDAVLKHFDAKKPKVVQSLRTNNGHSVPYLHISNATRRALQDALRPDAEELFKLVGKRFPWSWVQDADADWITTQPLGSIDLVATKFFTAKKDEEKASVAKTVSVPIVIMAHKRVEYMKQTMVSIDASDIPKNTPIIVSHDGHVPEMMEYMDSIEDRFNITRIYHPWACYDHPNSFPGNDAALNEGYAGDQYGNPRSEWATCAKHHWWWMMQTVWDMGYDTMFFTEEDYEVAPTIYQTIQTGLGLCDGDCFGVLLQPKHEVGDVWVEEAFQTGPMVLRRSSWEALWAAKKDFCEFDDYGWDWSVVHTMAVGKVPYKMVAPGKRQVRHIGAKGMHGREVVGAELSAFGGSQIRPGDARRPSKHRGNGGWGHRKDHEHCLHQTKWYVVTGNEIDRRRENVDKILTTFPWIQKMQGNDGFDEACVALLRSERIRVSPTYYDGSGKIHAGKIGHWCSFLTFLQRIGTQGVGVWIEDDVVLQSWKDVNAIQDAVSQASNAKPLQRFSHADGLLVVRNDPQLWQPLRERGITNPTDLLYAKLGLYDVKNNARITKLPNVPSTITTTSLLHIQDVNSRLYGKASTTHSSTENAPTRDSTTSIVNV